MKRIVSFIVALFLLMASLVACSSPSTTTTKAGTSGTSAAATTAQAKPVKMKLWIFLNPESTEDPRNVVLKNIVDNYNKSNTNGNSVTVESINWQKFEAQCIQAAAAGTGPDILNCYTDQLMQHVAAGTVQPMTSKAESFIATISDYTYAAKDLKINNEIYTLPWESRTFLFWYRDDAFGGKVPTSLGDLIEVAGKLSTGGNLGFTIGLSEGGNGASFMESFIPIIRSAGGDLFDSNSKAIFNSEAGIKAMQFFKDLGAKGVINNSVLSMTVDNVQDGFKAGTILSANLGTQRAATIRSSALSDKIKSAPMLGFESGKSAPATVAGQSLGIGKFAQNADASFDFIKTFYTIDAQKAWYSAKVMPVRTSIYDDAEIKKDASYAEKMTWSKYAATGKAVFYPADYTELATKMAQMAQKIVFQNAEIKASLDEVANWYNIKNKK